MQLALEEETNDLIKGATGGVVRVADGRFVVQQVRSKLQTALGGWLLDSSKGWVEQGDFVKDYNLHSLEARAREIILGTNGVLEIESLVVSIRNRLALIEFRAKTVFGFINLQVPWGGE